MSTAEVTTVREVAWHGMGSGPAGPVVLEIQREFFTAVHRKIPRYRAAHFRAGGRFGGRR